MAVTLRLRRIGKKKQPFYRIVAINSRAARGGRYIENIGTYNPLTNPAKIELKEDRALYWLKQGAIPSDTVRSFLRRKGILLKWHLIKRGVDEAGIEEELKKWEVLQLERQKRREALAEQKKREVIEKSAVEAEPEAEAELKEEGVKASTERDLEAVEVTEESKKKVSEKEEEKQIKASNKKDTETVKAKTDEKKRKVKEKRTAKVETKAELEEEGVKATPDKDLEAVEVTEESKEKVSKKNEQKQTGPRKRKTRNN